MFADAVRHHHAGRRVEAEQRCRQILALAPRHADGLHLLGIVALEAARFDLATDLIGKALAVRPNDPEARMNLANALVQQGRFDEAAASYRRVLDLKENNVEALINLGNILEELGRPDEAIACFRKALVFRPDLPDAHNNLGVALCSRGLFDEAVAAYLRALELRPNSVMALNNLAAALLAQGKPAPALNVVQRSLEIQEADDTKSLLVSCLSRADGSINDKGLRPLLLRALSEPWGRASELTRACIDLVKLDHDIAGRLDADDLAAVAADPLLLALLDAAPVCDIEMEQFLTTARHALLDAAGETAATGDGIAFYSALARQCFVNEYVFAVTADEARKARDLQGRLSATLEADAPVPALWLAAVAAYFPLHSVPLSARLLERSWPEGIAALLTQQVSEPAEERRISATVPRLTDIEDEVSLLVQRQYEENPYPRWIRIPPSRKAASIEAHLRQTFPLAAFDRSPARTRMEILVAGCGTGQQAIRTAQQFPAARILAIDLSRTSLAYALRKTRELGLSSIEYAQADVLELRSLARPFDLITASGVLHHLADPWRGWRTLLSLLRPGGFMLLGLYSRIARREVVRLRQSIAELGYGVTADEIRRCRQDFMNRSGGAGSADGRDSDLFTVSGCRDLLFHVQEHHVTLTEIGRFLQENGLVFLGFDIAADVLQSYRQRFPGDRAATNLAQWQVFEDENPGTFVGMYQFWVQKR